LEEVKKQILEDLGNESNSVAVTCVIKGIYCLRVILAEMWLGKMRTKCMHYLASLRINRVRIFS